MPTCRRWARLPGSVFFLATAKAGSYTPAVTVSVTYQVGGAEVESATPTV